jgi:hypothetical protein
MAVIDSSVLIHLARINRLSLLEKFFKKVKITENVRREVISGTGGSEIKDACGRWIAVARSKGVECWWLTTFLLICLKRKIVTKKEAKETLFGLVETGMHLNNAVFAAILKEIDSI